MTIGAAFGAAGQRCMALSVVLLVGDSIITDEWLQELVQKAQKLNVGPGHIAGIDIG